MLLCLQIYQPQKCSLPPVCVGWGVLVCVYVVLMLVHFFFPLSLCSMYCSTLQNEDCPCKLSCSGILKRTVAWQLHMLQNKQPPRKNEITGSLVTSQHNVNPIRQCKIDLSIQISVNPSLCTQVIIDYTNDKKQFVGQTQKLGTKCKTKVHFSCIPTSSVPRTKPMTAGMISRYVQSFTTKINPLFTSSL